MAALRSAGLDAAHLVGGIHAWREPDGATVRAADAGTLPLAAQAPGRLVVSLGLLGPSTMFADDHARLRARMLVCDARDAWCRGARVQTHRPGLRPGQMAMKT